MRLETLGPPPLINTTKAAARVAGNSHATCDERELETERTVRSSETLTYLLGFKTVVKARQFIAAQAIEGAEPRMVVRGNRDEMIRIAQSAGATSVLVDYEPATQAYGAIASF